MVDPQKMLSKSKCHILTHVVEDIRRFGPAITLSTETFESFNGVFRECSVMSNRHAPSRDIALNMADMARFKHIASGGTWRGKKGDWVGPGRRVTQLFRTEGHLHRLLGWADPKHDGKGILLTYYCQHIH